MSEIQTKCCVCEKYVSDSKITIVYDKGKRRYECTEKCRPKKEELIHQYKSIKATIKEIIRRTDTYLNPKYVDNTRDLDGTVNDPDESDVGYDTYKGAFGFGYRSYFVKPRNIIREINANDIEDIKLSKYKNPCINTNCYHYVEIYTPMYIYKGGFYGTQIYILLKNLEQIGKASETKGFKNVIEKELEHFNSFLTDNTFQQSIENLKNRKIMRLDNFSIHFSDNTYNNENIEEFEKKEQNKINLYQSILKKAKDIQTQLYELNPEELCYEILDNLKTATDNLQKQL